MIANYQSFENPDVLNQARELLALTAIVEDSLELAKAYIFEIIGSNSNFSSSYRNIVFDNILVVIIITALATIFFDVQF